MTTMQLPTKPGRNLDHFLGHQLGPWASLGEVLALLQCSCLNQIRTSNIRFTRRKVKQGESIYRSGQEFESLYLVSLGFIKTLLIDENGGEQVLCFPMRGDLLGIDGITNHHYVSTAIALEDSEVIVVPFKQLTSLGRELEELEQLIYQAISRELVREHNIIWVLGTLNAEARVTRFLLGLSERFSDLGYSPLQFNLRMTRQEIGNYLGLTLETVSRSLSALQAAGLINVHQKSIEIKNLAALRYAQFASHKLTPRSVRTSIQNHSKLPLEMRV